MDGKTLIVLLWTTLVGLIMAAVENMNTPVSPIMPGICINNSRIYSDYQLGE